MMTPTIHLNGTSKRELLEQQLTAMNAVSAARAALAAAAPNGRDYYPQGNEAIQHALDEHATRLGYLETVFAELEAIAQHISDH